MYSRDDDEGYRARQQQGQGGGYSQGPQGRGGQQEGYQQSSQGQGQAQQQGGDPNNAGSSSGAIGNVGTSGKTSGVSSGGNPGNSSSAGGSSKPGDAKQRHG